MDCFQAEIAGLAESQWPGSWRHVRPVARHSAGRLGLHWVSAASELALGECPPLRLSAWCIGERCSAVLHSCPQHLHHTVLHSHCQPTPPHSAAQLPQPTPLDLQASAPAHGIQRLFTSGQCPWTSKPVLQLMASRDLPASPHF